ncbi:hypothetical protein GRI58_15390 [Porphyrobacter algicida]|uniref:Uncharacterized protein n=1 Tax=Qipengyuania algicida TaxID=1836209 RepID=A0A845AM04_9SPHN|nr:hypothetical protein [Qipengyuania algicida]MXP30193.1 hypothetical protein [Qipengyuania algicida]
MSASKFVSGVGLIAIVCVWVSFLFTGEQQLPIEVANGLYFNPCCGKISIRDGFIAMADRRIRYVVEEDKVGAYVLPRQYIGVSNKRVVINSKAYPLKLRLDNPVTPHTIDLVDLSSGGYSYSFRRVNGS